MMPMRLRAWNGKNFVYWGFFEDSKYGIILAEPPLGVIFYEHQQYTGLKDKNGKKIYEGDIIKIEYRASKYSSEPLKRFVDIKWEVFWNQERLTFELRNKEKKYEPFLWSEIRQTNKKGDIVNMCEVVGNIFENPQEGGV